MRLKDLERLEQKDGAAQMDISRPTFQRILASARRKIACALLTGKAIRIEGGNFQLARCCQGRNERDNISVSPLSELSGNMKEDAS